MLDSGPVMSSSTPIRTGAWSEDCASALVMPTAPRIAALVAAAIKLALLFIFCLPFVRALCGSSFILAKSRDARCHDGRRFPIDATGDHDRQSIGEKLRSLVELVRLQEE